VPENGSASQFWTIVTLKEYVDRRFDDQKSATDVALAAADKMNVAALTAAEKAVTKAEVATEKRFDSVNEFRRTLTDQANLFLQRETFESFKDRVAQDLGTIRHDTQFSAETLAKTHASEIKTIYEWAGSVDKGISARVEKLENSQSRLIGALALASFLVPVVLYLIEHR